MKGRRGEVKKSLGKRIGERRGEEMEGNEGRRRGDKGDKKVAPSNLGLWIGQWKGEGREKARRGNWDGASRHFFFPCLLY